VPDAKASSTQVHFDAVQPHRTFEVVSDRIRDKLARGELRPGDKLPAERELAAQLGVSRSAVREALRSLEVNGVVQLKKGVKGGAFIVGGSPERMAQAMQDLVSIDAITLKDLTEARILLLDGVVRLAVARMDEGDLAALTANIDRTEAVIDADTLARFQWNRLAILAHRFFIRRRHAKIGHHFLDHLERD